MKRRTPWLAASLAAALLTGPAGAQQLFVYPQQGQSQEQQSRDEGECMSWARQQTGFNPMQGEAPVAEAEEKSVAGGTVKGAAGGAVGGAIIGAIAGDAGKGAAAGAAGGAMVGGMRRRDAKRQQAADQQAAEQKAKAEWEAQRDRFVRAQTTCLQGRGYSVN